MRNILTGIVLCFVGALTTNAQTVVWETQKTANRDVNDSVKDNPASADTLDTSIFIPEGFETNVESLLNSWYVHYYVKQSPQNNVQPSVRVSDEEYQNRLSRLPHIIEMPYNSIVKNYIDLYINRRSYVIEYMLGLSDFYFPMIERILDENQLPLELKYLAVVESALDPMALSRAGASGLWQFIVSTGKAYGLEINSLIDERRDPVKATYAACRYFKDMYDIYGDWNLVIASYNCGPGSVNKAIRRAGGKRDYWAIYNYLPRETRGYLPLFIAANYAMNYYAQHGLSPVSTNLPLATDTIMVNKILHFDQIAEMLNIDKEMIRALNPQYKRDIIPGYDDTPRPLLLPSTSAYAFISLGDSVYKYRAEELFTNRTYVEPGGYTAQGSNEERIVHKVRSGETMNTIANKYGVTVSDVKRWNNLRSSRLKVGSRIIIYADNGGFRISDNDSSSETSENSNTSNRITTTNSKSSNSSQLASGSFSKYKVRSGDTFASISKKSGVSVKTLMEFNKITNPKLIVGQIIKIPTT
ncbi:MAG: LysM peptidoglycan-binding domain-containing protein [Candidatus Azobacteroides sp.]|nr:LysM peptidoglycan-binding domain-containing protein [Candidatus Azobacteroides sp.]